jgi:hypothetical protein
MRAWIWGILITVLALGLIVVAVVVTGIIKIGEALSTETNATIRAKAEGEPVQFELGYGKDITSLNVFIVQDADGKELWKLEGVGEQKPARLVYGVVPEGGKQTVPTEGKPPDIRGKHIKVEVSCRFIIAMGAGNQSSYAEFDIPK